MLMFRFLSVLLVVITMCSYSTQDDGLLPFICELFQSPRAESCEDGVQVCSSSTSGNEQAGAECETSEPCAGVPCDTVGTLRDDSGNLRCTPSIECICRNGYYDGLCDKRMINAVCTADSLTVTAVSYVGNGDVPFNVYLSADGQFNFDPQDPCSYQEITGELTTRLETTPTVNGDDNCLLPPNVATVSGESVLSVYMYFQYTSQFQLAQDPVYEISCTAGSDVAVIQSHFDVARELEALPSTHAIVDGITMDLKVPNDAGGYDVITQETVLNIGDPVSLIVQRPVADGRFTLTNCEAATDSTFEESIYLLQDRCVNSPMNALYSDRIQSASNGATETLEGGDPNNHVLRLPLKAFVMKVTSSIHLRCTACTADSCIPPSPTTCPNDITSVLIFSFSGARKRRDVTGSSEVDLAVSVEVRHPGYTADPNTSIIGIGSGADDNSPVNVTSCYRSVAVVLPVSLLASLLLVAMVMTFFFCTKLTNHVQDDNNSIKKP